MIAKLTSRDRRALAGLMLVVAPVLCWRLVAQPWRALQRDLRDRLERQAELLESDRLDMTRGPQYAVALTAAKERLDGAERILFHAQSTSMAEAAVAEHARAVAELSGVQLRSVDTPGVDMERPDLGSIRLAISGEAHLLGFLVFLRRLEAGAGRPVTRGIAIQKTRASDGDVTMLSFELAVDVHFVLRNVANQATAAALQ